ncbi:MAG TPA: histidine phosphatase family protein [Ignavibacteriaceae bacterium]|nr:histidine phosphatase family protein [Ignavibacteriaceae bacterium]
MKIFNIIQIIFLFLLILPFNLYSQSSFEEQKGTRTIYLIRHGEYDQADTSDSDIGKKLTPLGISQARLVSARLKGMPVKFTSLKSSTMTRARETAMVINQDFPELKLQQSTLIRECTPPTWRKDIMADETESDLNMCAKNLEKAFGEYFAPSPDGNDRNDIIVCHGNVIRYFVTKVLKADPMSWLQMSIGNCSLTIIRILPDGSMKLAAYGDMGHIPPNMQTETGGNNSPKELIIPENK